ncbi:hypothetical protein T439DRAFT_99735 [Meredithblackwellia eburnea MCA 4105]
MKRKHNQISTSVDGHSDEEGEVERSGKGQALDQDSKGMSSEEGGDDHKSPVSTNNDSDEEEEPALVTKEFEELLGSLQALMASSSRRSRQQGKANLRFGAALMQFLDIHSFSSAVRNAFLKRRTFFSASNVPYQVVAPRFYSALNIALNSDAGGTDIGVDYINQRILDQIPLPDTVWSKAQAVLRDAGREGGPRNEREVDALVSSLLRTIKNTLFPGLISVLLESYLPPTDPLSGECSRRPVTPLLSQPYKSSWQLKTGRLSWLNHWLRSTLPSRVIETKWLKSTCICSW